MRHQPAYTAPPRLPLLRWRKKQLRADAIACERHRRASRGLARSCGQPGCKFQGVLHCLNHYAQTTSLLEEVRVTNEANRLSVAINRKSTLCHHIQLISSNMGSPEFAPTPLPNAVM